MTQRLCDARVARGARFLDGNRPGWIHEVNVKTLNMKRGETCVLGQLYGGFPTGFRYLQAQGALSENEKTLARQLVSHGFTLEFHATAEDWEELRAAWERQTLRRLSAPPRFGYRHLSTERGHGYV